MGDLWDLVLVDHGHKTVSLRKNGSRDARYQNRYTRDVFEKLWTGKEELCPYYWDGVSMTTDEESSTAVGRGLGASVERGSDEDQSEEDADNDERDNSSDSEDEGGCMLD